MSMIEEGDLDINERIENRRALEEFANSSAQQQPRGHGLVKPTSGLAERVIGAQPVAVYRDEAKILQKLSAMAAAAGTDWFYRFPVKKKLEDGTFGKDWIEGPSIKLANDVARIFGNNLNEVREIDVGDAWVFYARFTDIETGFSYERAYRQRKSQGSLRANQKDPDRQLDIAYQIGQSKAIRNCICNALQIYSDFAFEQARNSLVEKIGKDLPAWRDRVLQGLANIPVDVARVERVMGRAAKDWLAPHLAQVIAMMKSIADGMSSSEEAFPQIERPAEAAEAPAAEAKAAAEARAAAEAKGAAEPKPEGKAAEPKPEAPSGPEKAAAGPASQNDIFPGDRVEATDKPIGKGGKKETK